MNLLYVCFGLAMIGSQFGDLHAAGPGGWVKKLTRRDSAGPSYEALPTETQMFLTSKEVKKVRKCVKSLFSWIEEMVREFTITLPDWRGNFEGNIAGSESDGSYEISIVKTWLESACNQMKSGFTFQINIERGTEVVKDCVKKYIGAQRGSILNDVLDTFANRMLHK